MESAFSCWWENLFSGSADYSKAWSILLHPVLVILIIQILIIICMVLLVYWIREKLSRIKGINYKLILNRMVQPPVKVLSKVTGLTMPVMQH